jgi:hypothetical protein
MKKKGKASRANRKSTGRDQDDNSGQQDGEPVHQIAREILPSDKNDSDEVSSRIAFLAYN